MAETKYDFMISLRLPRALHERLSHLAEEGNRSVSDEIRLRLLDSLEHRGRFTLVMEMAQ